jgi:hypothetical protein
MPKKKALGAIVVALAVGAPPQATAQDETHACTQASEAGLSAKHSGHLVAAHTALLGCVRDVCPKVMRDDCAQQLATVDAATPSIVFGATDASGKDLLDVRVSIDGTVATSHLDGKAVPLDPGKHVLRFEADGLEPQDQEILAREGEKNRNVTVHLQPVGGAASAAAEAGAPAATSASTAGPTSSPPAASGPPVLAYAIGGVGVVALGLGTYFAVDQAQRYSHLHDTCAPAHTCSQSDIDAVNNERVYEGIALGVGGAAVTLAVVLLLTRHTEATARTGLVWTVVPTQHGAAGAVGLSF